MNTSRGSSFFAQSSSTPNFYSLAPPRNSGMKSACRSSTTMLCRSIQSKHFVFVIPDFRQVKFSVIPDFRQVCRGRGCLSDFELRELSPNSGFNSRCRETVPNYFPISENGFRCRGTVSDIGKQFPMSGNSFRYRETVSDVGEQSRFPNFFSMSENDFRYWETVYAVGEHLDRFEQIRTEQESRLYYRSGQERIKKVFYALLI